MEKGYIGVATKSALSFFKIIKNQIKSKKKNQKKNQKNRIKQFFD